MLVKNIKWEPRPLPTNFYSKRRVALYHDTTIRVVTDQGTFILKAKEGFNTDGRSGGFLVDFIIPHYGDEKTFICWLAHDILFCLGEKEFTFELANELLDAMLKFTGRCAWKRKLVSIGVGSGAGRKAFETQDKWDEMNKNLVSAELVANNDDY